MLCMEHAWELYLSKNGETNHVKIWTIYVCCKIWKFYVYKNCVFLSRFWFNTVTFVSFIYTIKSCQFFFDVLLVLHLFLTLKPPDYVDWSREELEALLEFRCDENDKLMLTNGVTAEEVQKVLFSMPSNKSLGPDVYSCEFFKETWQMVGKDFVVAIQSFFKTGFLPKGVNSTILALIPKRKEATVMKDYRPISCCNVLYKVISKILANRLKLILPKFISAKSIRLC